jgi:hypothetical protein
MSTEAPNLWREANGRYLSARLAAVRNLLRQVRDDAPMREREAAQASLPAPAALDRLCSVFALSDFERDILLLTAGVELDAEFAMECSLAQGQKHTGGATVALAMAILPESTWLALTPVAPLRYWRLIEITGDGLLSQSTIRIDERVLHYLQGISYLDVRLRGGIELVPPPDDLPPSQQKLASEAAACLTRAERMDAVPVLQLCGDGVARKRAIAAACCALADVQLHALKSSDLPSLGAERAAMSRLWQREALLSNSALLIEVDDGSSNAATASFIERTPGMLLVSSREPIALDRPTVRMECARPSALEQRALWKVALGERAQRLNGHLATLTAQFDLDAAEIHAASAQAMSASAAEDGEAFATGLWTACRQQARRHIRDLTRHVEPAADWRDLVLPDAQLRTLRDMVSQVRHRATVHDEWGFAAKGSRGLGISALFAGVSGTGKTLAAEVIAADLRLDLHHIDLSQIVSKYIGETEKNLREVFDAAQDGAAVLLFDEADALFGKRSDVRDSHDRYANIEVSYLLQRMEAYRGLAILTTNMKSQIDAAFLRRLRFIVQFPFPDATQRAAIWSRIFPASVPTEGLQMERLAQLSVSGGSIRNIALHSSFFAADANEPVRMAHLLRAAQVECTKLEKSISPQEVRGWM